MNRTAPRRTLGHTRPLTPDAYRSNVAARLWNNASAADLRALTGETTADAQRDACDRMGVRYTQRRVALPHGGTVKVDECNVWVTPDVLARIDAARTLAPIPDDELSRAHFLIDQIEDTDRRAAAITTPEPDEPSDEAIGRSQACVRNFIADHAALMVAQPVQQQQCCANSAALSSYHDQQDVAEAIEERAREEAEREVDADPALLWEEIDGSDAIEIVRRLAEARPANGETDAAARAAEAEVIFAELRGGAIERAVAWALDASDARYAA